MKKKKLPKERNPFVEFMRARKAGSHEKTKKAQRVAYKISLKKNKYDE